MAGMTGISGMTGLSPRFAEFLAGGIASCAAELLTLPLDTIKVRIMLSKRGEFKWSSLLSPRVLISTFDGLDAALIRQLFYGTLRFGLYPVCQQLILLAIVWDVTRPPPASLVRVLAGFCCGAIASFICNPADLVKVRIQGKYRGQYSSALAAYYIIIRDEGVLALWTGVVPTVYRAAILAAVELSSYDGIKGYLAAWLDLGLDDSRVFMLAALFASVLTAFFSCPFDVARSRIMNAQSDRGKGGGLKYRGVVHCLVVSVKEEGFAVMWNGVISYFLRLGPNAVFTFLFLEKARALLLNVSR
jgi:hypothetical protein